MGLLRLCLRRQAAAVAAGEPGGTGREGKGRPPEGQGSLSAPVRWRPAPGGPPGDPTGTTANAQGSLPDHCARKGGRSGNASRSPQSHHGPRSHEGTHMPPSVCWAARPLAGELRPVPAGLAGGGARPRRDKPGVVVDGG